MSKSASVECRVYADEKVIASIRKVVAEKGEDYTYPPEEYVSGDVCAYLTYDEDGRPTGPSCIVGHVAVDLGINMAVLTEKEGVMANGALAFYFSNTAALALTTAQMKQDSGASWGSALREFERVMGQ